MREKDTSDQEEKLHGKLTRLSECHTFEWSHKLWGSAALKVFRAAILASALYLAVAVWGCWAEGLRGVDIPYFLVSSLTTVGLGDIVPKYQSSRLSAIIMLPAGLVLLCKSRELSFHMLDHLESQCNYYLLSSLSVFHRNCRGLFKGQCFTRNAFARKKNRREPEHHPEKIHS